MVHVGEVDVIDARPRAVRRRAVVEGDRGGVLAERLDRADLERRPRQPPEPTRRRRHHLGDEAAGVGEILLPALVGIGIFELRALVDVAEELLERTGEAYLALDPLHLAVDALDLLEADAVDLVGGEVDRGRDAQAMVVIIGPLRQAPCAVVAGRSSFDRIQCRQHRLVAAAERANQRVARGDDQPVLLGLCNVEAADLGLEVREHRHVGPVGEGRASEDPAAVGAHRIEVEARRHDSELGLAAHVGGDLAHHPLDLAQPRDVCLCVGDAVDAVVVDQEHGQIAHRAAVVGRRKAVPAPAERLAVALHFLLEQSV